MGKNIIREKEKDHATMSVKITPQQRLGIINIGRAEGVDYVYEVVQILIDVYKRAKKGE